MKRVLIAVAVVLAMSLSFALAASGALMKDPVVFPPKKRGVYVGMIKSTFDLAITLKVSKTGKSARIVWACGTGRGTTAAPNVPIDATSRFKASGNLWSLSGRFVSATQARFTLSDIRCGGSKGSTKLTLK
jgi:predicted small lipoprotein YifL